MSSHIQQDYTQQSSDLRFGVFAGSSFTSMLLP